MTADQRIVVGGDPGQRGGIAAVDVDTGELAYATPIPMSGEGRSRYPNVVAFRRFKFDTRIQLVMVEQVSSFAGESPMASFRFGRTFQHLLSMGDLHPVRTVTPAVWGKEFNLPKAGRTAQSRRAKKQATLAVCRSLWPEQRHRFTSVDQHSGHADAALIAEYGRRRILPDL